MFGAFRLKSPLGRSYSVDLDDSLRTKKALQGLGYYREPDYGLTPYPDEPLFQGIERFQRDHGLNRDGIMRPEGETATRLGEVLGERSPQKAAEKTRNPVRQNKPFIGTKREKPTPPSGLEKKTPQKKPFTGFRLLTPVGAGQPSLPADKLAAKQALALTGFYPASYTKDGADPDDFGLMLATRNFQRRHGLTVDGWMGPGGETERTLDGKVRPVLEGWLKLADVLAKGKDGGDGSGDGGDGGDGEGEEPQPGDPAPDDPEEPEEPPEEEPEEPGEPDEDEPEEEGPCQQLREEVHSLRDQLQENLTQQDTVLGQIEEKEAEVDRIRAGMPPIEKVVEEREEDDCDLGPPAMFWNPKAWAKKLRNCAVSPTTLNRGENEWLYRRDLKRTFQLGEEIKKLYQNLESLKDEENRIRNDLKNTKQKLDQCEGAGS